MKLIVITVPQFFEGEAAAITLLFRAGLEILHLRKPGASESEVGNLLRQIPEEYRRRIVTHEHFRLSAAWRLKGIHLNGRNPHIPVGYTGHVSCSCHSLAEVAERKPVCDYVFLSPVYDSISKEGYASAFSYETLQQARQDGIIDARVMALGGVNQSRFSALKRVGFGGVALLGDIWQQPVSDFVSHFRLLRQSLSPDLNLTDL